MRIAVYGLGKAGSALLHTFGRRVVVSTSRSSKRRRAARDFAPVSPRTFWGMLDAVDVVFLAVRDDAIEEVAALFPPDIFLVHMAGARGTDFRDGPTGSFHPLAALCANERIPAGATIGVAGHQSEKLMRLARDYDLVPTAVKDRVAYHAGAVMTANLSMALLAHGIALLEEAGFSEADARRGLSRLLASAAKRAECQTMSKAITGPVARGDAGTLAAHMKMLDGPRAAVYRMLSIALTESIDLDDQVRAELFRALR